MAEAAQETQPSKSPAAARGGIFSVSSFLHGLGAGAIIFALLFLWMWLRAEDTITRQQDKLPTKTAIIERGSEASAASPLTQSVLEAPAKKFTPEAVETLTEEEETISVPETTAAPAHEEAPPAASEAVPATEAVTEEAVAADPSVALPKAPIEGLYETRPEGQIPIADHARAQIPFDVYKRPVSLVPGRPRVSLVFVQTGLSQNLSEKLITEMPLDVTMAVSPYAQKPGVWTDKVRAAGHESWLILPLQTDDYPDTDPGPYAILNNITVENSQGRLFSVLGLAAGYAGLLSMNDHNFTEADMDASPVMRQIFGRGLAFADGRTDRPFFAQALAKEQNYPHTQADLWIEDDLTEAGALNALDAAGRHALSNGEVSVFIKPSAANVQAVLEWTKDIGAKGLQLVPLSSLIKQ